MSSVLKIWLSSSAVVRGQERELFYLPRNLMMVMEANRFNGRDKNLVDLPGGLGRENMKFERLSHCNCC